MKTEKKCTLLFMLGVIMLGSAFLFKSLTFQIPIVIAGLIIEIFAVVLCPKKTKSIYMKRFEEIMLSVPDDGVGNDLRIEIIKAAGVLYLHAPLGAGSKEPIVDKLTLKAAWLWNRKELVWDTLPGTYRCTCEASNSVSDYVIPSPDGYKYMLINSLFLHFVAYHRHNIQSSEMEKLLRLTSMADEEVPKEEDMLPSIM